MVGVALSYKKIMDLKTKLKTQTKATLFWQFISILLGSICLISTFYYIFITYRYYFHSDSAIKNIIAEEILYTGQLFPETWYYGNGDIWGIYSHLLIVPLLKFFKNGFFVHAMSSAIFALLFIGSLVFFNYSLRKNFSILLLFVIVFFSGFSPWMVENLFGQVPYGYAWGTFFSFIIWSLLFLAMNCQAHVKVHVSLMFIFALITCTGVRFVVDIYIPIVISLLIISFYQYLNEKIQVIKWKSIFLILSSCSAGCLLGLLVNQYLKSQVSFIDISNKLVLIDYETVIENFKILVSGYLFSAGINLAPDAMYAIPTLHNSPVSSMAGVEALYRLCLFGTVYLLPFLLLFRLFRLQSSILIVLNLSYVIHFLITAFLYLLSSDLAVNACTSRYFFLVQISAFVITLLYLSDLTEKYGRKVLHFSVLTLIPLVFFNMNYLVFDAHSSTSTAGSLKHKKNDEIAKFLISKNLKFGYASFWNAYAPRILSNSKVNINAVSFLDEIVLPLRMLTSKRWYQGNSYHGTSFILMQEEEYKKVACFLEKKLGIPKNKYTFQKYIINVYTFNIAKKLQAIWQSVSLNEKLEKNERRLKIEGETSYTACRGDKVLISLKITNTSNQVISSAGTYPVNIGGHLLSQGGDVMSYDYFRIPFPYCLEPGQTIKMKKEVRFETTGKYVIEIDGVQEGVAWFENPLKIIVHVT